MNAMTGRSRASFVARLAVVSLGVAVCAAMLPMIGGPAAPAGAAPNQIVARYELNEAAGSSVLVDSSGNNLNGTIGGDVQHPVTVGDGTGHRFPYISPDTTVTYPNHDDIVQDNSILDPGTDEFAITVRYRKTTSFGNLLQKGQNTVAGGYFKIEMPGQTASCLFKDGAGKSGGVTSPPTLNMSDGQWHVIRCERLKAEVNMWVDGVEVAKTGSAVGSISNSWPLVFGGKIDCNPAPTDGSTLVTCDYYSGDIDYVYFEKTIANQLPHASFTQSLSKNTFTFNATKSTDADGAIASYAWNYGDGSTGTGVTTTHAYAAAGTYTVTLVVTDNDGAIATTTLSVKAPAPPATTTTTTTTTTIVAQLPPEGLTNVPSAASAGATAHRGTAFQATETATTVAGG
jgi:hypothetical protein